MQGDSTCCQPSDLTFSDKSFCLQVNIQCTQANTKFPTPHHLITNLAYRLKLHHRRNLCLRARLDTYADVNIIPASVYKLVFQDPDCKKLAPSKPEIGLYATDTVKLVGFCMFYLVHPDTKCLQEVTVYVGSNNGSVLLPCAATLALVLIQPHTRLDYLLPRVSLITSSAGHPKRDQVQNTLHLSKKESEVSNHKGMVSKLITSKDQILAYYSDVFDGNGCFPGSPIPYPGQFQCHTQANPLSTNPCTSKRVCQERD